MAWFQNMYMHEALIVLISKQIDESWASFKHMSQSYIKVWCKGENRNGSREVYKLDGHLCLPRVDKGKEVSVRIF